MIEDKTIVFKFKPRALLVEGFATMTLCYIGGMAGFSGAQASIEGANYEMATVGGIVLALMIIFSFDISGAQFNPAVSLGAAFARMMEWKTAILFVVAQLIGSILGATLLHFTVQSESRYLLSGSYPQPNPTYTGWNLFWYEVCGAFMLMYGFLYILDNKGTKYQMAFHVFTVIVGNTLAVSQISGACFNPARYFGPSLSENNPNFKYWYIYWVGPISGALLAVVFFHWIIKGDSIWKFFYRPRIVDKIEDLFKRSDRQ